MGNLMEPDKTIKNQWVHVVIQNPGTPGEELMGYGTEQIPEPFIPAFTTREEAQACFLMMPKDIMNKKYEVHAILKEDLIEQARTNGFRVFLMDDKSSIKEELC
ncbi:hypothetical protein [Desulfocicer vacuolatum]|nr:hypothetical protein [Desulfocicer vacuolatum]